MREKALVDDEVDLLSFKEALKKLRSIDANLNLSSTLHSAYLPKPAYLPVSFRNVPRLYPLPMPLF